MEHVKPVMRA